MKINEILQELSNIAEDLKDTTCDLYEQALGRKYVKDKICDLSDTIVDHVCKIYYLKDEMPSTVHHWCAEILAAIDKVIGLQIKGGDLKENLLMEWLRNGLTNSSEMTNRRRLVAKQEKININRCKSLDDSDYENIINIVKALTSYIIERRADSEITTVEDIKAICT